MKNLIGSLREFLALEAAGGILLVIAAVAALALANSPAAWLYERLLAVPVEIRVERLEIAKPLLLWINDGLMAVFFFLVGLEIKREVLQGESRSARRSRCRQLPRWAAWRATRDVGRSAWS